jgi:hypothetical protein
LTRERIEVRVSRIAFIILIVFLPFRSGRIFGRQAELERAQEMGIEMRHHCDAVKNR